MYRWFFMSLYVACVVLLLFENLIYFPFVSLDNLAYVRERI